MGGEDGRRLLTVIGEGGSKLLRIAQIRPNMGKNVYGGTPAILRELYGELEYQLGEVRRYTKIRCTSLEIANYLQGDLWVADGKWNTNETKNAKSSSALKYRVGEVNGSQSARSTLGAGRVSRK